MCHLTVGQKSKGKAKRLDNVSIDVEMYTVVHKNVAFLFDYNCGYSTDFCNFCIALIVLKFCVRLYIYHSTLIVCTPSMEPKMN